MYLVPRSQRINQLALALLLLPLAHQFHVEIGNGAAYLISYYLN